MKKIGKAIRAHATKSKSLDDYLQIANHAARWANAQNPLAAHPALRPYMKRVPSDRADHIDRGFWFSEVLDDLRRDAKRDLNLAEMRRFDSVVQLMTATPPPGYGSAVKAAHAKIKKTGRQLDREIAEALSSRKGHATQKAGSKTGRWIHRTVAQSYGLPEDVVRRIYETVQTAKRQGLYGGYLADLIDRNVGRRLVGHEYDVVTRAKDHLNYHPASGYGGPKPTGAAKEPPRAEYDDPKRDKASRLAAKGDGIIKDVLGRRRHPTFGWDESNDGEDRRLLKQAAEELEVAADLYEDAGMQVRAGTIRQRASYARQGNYRMLDAYGN